MNMSEKNKQLGSEPIPGSSSLENDHTSLLDLKNLILKNHEDVMSEVMNLKAWMQRILTDKKSNMVEIRAPSTGSRCLKLVFRNNISLPVLNGEEIKGEGGKYMEVALVDNVTGTVVDFGQESSALVEIVALDGESDYCEIDNTWVIGNYKNKTSVSERDEKRSVLVGQVKLKLKKGIGSLVNVKFKSSSNHNSGVFKLGARVLDSFHGTVIKEAMTEPFAVKDFREKYKQKHYPPSLSDEIWRLENIQKGGSIYERVKEKVKTVEDFLIHYLKDPAGLKSLFRLQEKKWDATVSHAQTCTVNQKVYCRVNSQQKKGVVFNVVGKTLGLIKDLKYVHNDMLSEEDKVDARKLLSVEFMEEVKEFDNEDSLRQFLSKMGESDQLNLEPSSQYALNPDRGIIVSQEPEATALDSVNFPTACSGLVAPLQDPICKDQETNNINNADENVMNMLSPSQELELDAIFPSISPTGGGIGTSRILEGPHKDESKDFDASLEDFMLSLCPIEVGQASESYGFHDLIQDMDVEAYHNDSFLNSPKGPLWCDSIHHQYLMEVGQASESYGFHDLIQDMDVETYHNNSFLNSPMGPLWQDSIHHQYHDHGHQSYISDDGNQNWTSECSFKDCLNAANRRWKKILGVVKWCLKIKKAAMGYRLNKNGKQRI